MTDLRAGWVDRIPRQRAREREHKGARKPRRRRRVRRRFNALSAVELVERARIGARRSNAAQRLDKVLGWADEDD